jgi:hypothetical protein
VTQETVLSVSVDAPAEVVFGTIVSPQGLATWLANQARSEKRPGGRVHLAWNDGGQAIGQWAAFDPPHGATLRASFLDQAEPTSITFDVRPSGAGCVVKMSVSPGLEGDGPWAAPFRHALEDLCTYCETGRAGAMERRPMVGVNFEEVDADAAEKRNLPGEGIMLTEVVADSGAAKAGMQKGDLIVAVGGHKVQDWASVGAALDRFEVGQVVRIDGFRGVEPLAVDVLLGSRPRPDLSTDATALRQSAKSAYESCMRAVADVLAGVTEAQAEHKPGEHEWSTKQVLVHLSDLERWLADDMARLAGDDAAVGWSEPAIHVKGAALAALTARQLQIRLETDMLETMAVTDHVLSAHATPAVCHYVAEGLTWWPEHVTEHVGQIKANLESASAAGVA